MSFNVEKTNLHHLALITESCIFLNNDEKSIFLKTCNFIDCIKNSTTPYDIQVFGSPVLFSICKTFRSSKISCCNCGSSEQTIVLSIVSNKTASNENCFSMWSLSSCFSTTHLLVTRYMKTTYNKVNASNCKIGFGNIFHCGWGSPEVETKHWNIINNDCYSIIGHNALKISPYYYMNCISNNNKVLLYNMALGQISYEINTANIFSTVMSYETTQSVTLTLVNCVYDTQPTIPTIISR